MIVQEPGQMRRGEPIRDMNGAPPLSWSPWALPFIRMGSTPPDSMQPGRQGMFLLCRPYYYPVTSARCSARPIDSRIGSAACRAVKSALLPIPCQPMPISDCAIAPPSVSPGPGRMMTSGAYSRTATCTESAKS